MSVEPDWPSVLTIFLADASRLFRARGGDPDGEEAEDDASSAASVAAVHQDVARLLELFTRRVQRVLGADAPDITVAWSTPTRRYVAAMMNGEAVVTIDPPEVVHNGPRRDLTLERLYYEWEYPEEGGPPRRVQISERGAVETLRFTHRGATLSPAWDSFARSLPSLNALYRGFRAVLDARVAADAARQRAEITSQLRALRRDAVGDLDALLEQAERALDAIPAERPEDFEDLAEELLVVVVQGIMGTGWGVRPLAEYAGPPAAGERGDRRLDVVRRIEQRYLLRAESTPPPRRVGLTTLDRLARTIRAVVHPNDDSPIALLYEPAGSDAERYAALDLFPVWTRLHELLRPLVDLRARFGPERDIARAAAAWASAYDATLGRDGATGRLVRILAAGATFRGAESAPRDAPGAPAPSARHMLTLWLCWRVLTHVGRAPELCGARIVSVLAELAYALRETLRAVCFAPFHEHFFHQAAYLTAAVRRLVEYHAVEVTGVPEEAGLGALLHHLSQPTGSMDDALGHLQHLFEVYLAGHFLLECRVDNDTLADALADPETGATQLRRSYSLAALFHDVGQGLHPEERLRRSAHRLDGFSAAALGVEAELAATARSIAARYERELSALPGCSFVAETIAESRRAPGDPDHALRSAHFMLHRRGVQQLLRGSAEGYQIVRDAARAILLHEHTGRIDATGDPTASLLAFCNAVFEWDPGRALGTQPGEVGRAVHVMAAPVALREPRDATIGIRGLRGEARGDHFVAYLPSSAGATGPWPDVRIRLQHPLRLDVMTWRIWLNHKRSIERLTEGRGGWRPGVSLRAPMSDAVRAYVPGGTRALLLEVAERPECGELASLLRRWLAPPRGGGDPAGVAPAPLRGAPHLGSPAEDFIVIGARGEPPLLLDEPEVSYRSFVAVLDREVRRLLSPA